MSILAGLMSLLGCSSSSSEYVDKELGFQLQYPEGWRDNRSPRPGSAPLLATLARITGHNSELSFSIKKARKLDAYLDAFKRKGEEVAPDAALTTLHPGMAALQAYSLKVNEKLFSQYRVLGIGPAEFAGVRGVEIMEYARDEKEYYIKSFIPNGDSPYAAIILSLESSAGEGALSSDAARALERAWRWGN